MHFFLHKCLILVEATGLEGVPKLQNTFIYKGLRVFTPHRSPKIFIHFPNVIILILWLTTLTSG